MAVIVLDVAAQIEAAAAREGTRRRSPDPDRTSGRRKAAVFAVGDAHDLKPSSRRMCSPMRWACGLSSASRMVLMRGYFFLAVGSVAGSRRLGGAGRARVRLGIERRRSGHRRHRHIALNPALASAGDRHGGRNIPLGMDSSSECRSWRPSLGIRTAPHEAGELVNHARVPRDFRFVLHARHGHRIGFRNRQFHRLAVSSWPASAYSLSG